MVSKKIKKLDKRIFEALEDNNKKSKIGDLVGGFTAILIGQYVLNEMTKVLENEEKGQETIKSTKRKIK